MARNYIPLDQVVGDFIAMMDSDDFGSNVGDTLVRGHALRGIREMGFDVSKRVKSLLLDVNTSNSTANLPDDFVDLIKVGVVGQDGLVYVFGENKNLNVSMAYAEDSAGNFIDSDSDGVYDRVDSKGRPTDYNSLRGYDSYVFRNYLYENTYGQLYGIGGGTYSGEFRLNLEQNRIELSIQSGITQIVMEYVADEARSLNPSIHVYMEQALRSYIYYHIIERKANVPMGEKSRARQDYYNERRLANARMKAVSKEEILKTIRKNTKQAPKF